MTEPTHELEAYFADDATDEQLVAVEVWINADPANARAFMQQLHFRELLGEHLREQRSDNRAVLAELLQLEAAQEADLVTIIDLDNKDYAAISGTDLKAAGSYLLTHGVTPKRLAFAGLAAAVALGLTVFLLLQSATPSPDSPSDFVRTPEQVQPARSTVATLTATHNAKWAEGAFPLGSRLRAGQKLQLAAGFAEITTNEGAVVLLEAPATFELLEQSNALQLHAGKLAATVPEQALGFTVHTPKARVIDYGTEFGVEVRTDGSTNTAVFTGEVELSEVGNTPDQPTRSVRLTAGWASRVSAKGVLHREPKQVNVIDRSRFAMSIETVIEPSFAYRRAVLSSKPLVYWGFDQGQANTENMAGNSDWSGKAIGQTRMVQGLFGNAVQLTGQIESMGGYASVSPLKLADASRYTLEAWCWIDQPHYGRVIGLAEVGQGKTYFSRHASMLEVVGGEGLSESLRASNPSVRFYHRSDLLDRVAPEQSSFSPTGPPIGQWVHLVAVRDGNLARLYINGEMVSESTDDQPDTKDKELSLFVGVSPTMLAPNPSTRINEHRCFNGLIDEVAVYGHALKAEQIALHYQLGLDSSLSGDD